MRRIVHVFLLPLVITSLAACGASAPGATLQPTGEPDTPSSTAAPETPGPVVLTELGDLQDAVTAVTGDDCLGGWVEREGPPGASVTGDCVGVGISLFPEVADRNRVLELNVTGTEYQDFVVRPGWLITVDETTPNSLLTGLADATGGVYWTISDPIPSA
jgi:hypothetical protein